MRPFFVFAIGAVGAGIVAAIVVRLSDPLIGPEPGRLLLLVQIAAASGAAAVVYALYTRLLRIPELQQTIDIARLFVRRRGGTGDAQ